MSMIRNLTDRMTEYYYRLRTLCDRGFDYKDEVALMEEAISTIKELSEKLRAANMERSDVYYNGQKDIELLDREEVLGVLDELCVVDGIYSAIADLPVIAGKPYEERSSQYYNGGWIPCEERLPVQPPDTFHDGHYWFTPCDDYIVCDSEGKVYVASFMFCNNFWFYRISSNQIKNIIAWRPLPELYQPKESEE